MLIKQFDWIAFQSTKAQYLFAKHVYFVYWLVNHWIIVFSAVLIVTNVSNSIKSKISSSKIKFTKKKSQPKLFRVKLSSFAFFLATSICTLLTFQSFKNLP